MADYSGNSKASSSSSKMLLMTDDDGINNNRSSPSVHAVMFNDDLLIEILLRLPVISLFFFKFVSKRWLSLITSPAFYNLRLTRFPNIPPPSDLFLQKVKEVATLHFDIKHDFLSLDSRIPMARKSAFTFGSFGPDASSVQVLQSCNGLVLFVMKPKLSDRIYVSGLNRPFKSFTLPSDQIYVYNPSINVFRILPPIPGLKISTFSHLMRLAFDPAKSPHYKVLHVNLTVRPNPTRVYSSETDIWSMGDTFPSEWFPVTFAKGVYWNDALHWFDNKNRVRHFQLDVEHPDDRTSQLPENLDKKDSYKALFESRRCLLLACTRDPHSKNLEIYEMENGYSGWSVRYVVKYEESIEAFFETWKMSTVRFRFKVLFIVVGEREEESYVVMELCRKVVKYNLLLKTLDVLCDMDAHLTKFGTFPFIASFAGV